MNTQNIIIDDAVRSVIGARGEVRHATDAVSTSEIRRFGQAIFDDNRIYYDANAALASRYRARVGPGTFFVTCMRPNIPFSDDPLRRIGANEDSSMPEETRPYPKGWAEMYSYHAGDEVVLHRLPHEGDRLSSQPVVTDIFGKSGRNGNLAFYVTRTDYTDQHGVRVGSHERTLALPERYKEESHGPARPEHGAAETLDPPPMPAAKPLDLPRVDFEDIHAGDTLTPRAYRLTVPTIVRWAMAIEQSYRRDHYDHDFATRVLGHANIIGSGLWMLSCRWSYVSHFAGCDGWVWKISHQLRARMNVGDTLTASGTVTALERRERYGLVQLDVRFTNQNGVVAIPGAASVALPYRGGPAVPYPFVP